MNSYTATCCLLLLCVATGCDTVTVTEPIGDAESISEVRKLQGTWINDDKDSMIIHVSQDGGATIGILTWDEETEKFRADNVKLFATKAGDLRLLHTTSTGESSNDEYLFCRYEHADEKTIRLYYPVPSRFEKAVQSGMLDGVVKKRRRSTTTKLKTTGERLVTFLAQTDGNDCFEQKPSMTLSLVKRSE